MFVIGRKGELLMEYKKGDRVLQCPYCRKAFAGAARRMQNSRFKYEYFKPFHHTFYLTKCRECKKAFMFRQAHAQDLKKSDVPIILTTDEFKERIATENALLDVFQSRINYVEAGGQ